MKMRRSVLSTPLVGSNPMVAGPFDVCPTMGELSGKYMRG
jgi:hypothetical protein